MVPSTEKTTTPVRLNRTQRRWTIFGISAISLRPDRHGAQVAQLVEHVTENHGVGGSIPPLGTIFTQQYQIVKPVGVEPIDFAGALGLHAGLQ
jgi:hypothetical protein